jgi:hypothetical protein
VGKARENLLKNDVILQQFGEKAINNAIQKETIHLTENFPELNPDQLQNIATKRRDMASPTFEQIAAGKKNLTLEQYINTELHDVFHDAIEDMYSKTPGAEYARKVYGATKTIDKGIEGLTEKIAREQYKDNPNLKQIISSPATLLGGALALAGDASIGVPLMTVKAASQGAKMIKAHLDHPNTKISKAFDQMRGKMRVHEKPQYTPTPAIPTLPTVSAAAPYSGQPVP